MDKSFNEKLEEHLKKLKTWRDFSFVLLSFYLRHQKSIPESYCIIWNILCKIIRVQSILIICTFSFFTKQSLIIQLLSSTSLKKLFVCFSVDWRQCLFASKIAIDRSVPHGKQITCRLNNLFRVIVYFSMSVQIVQLVYAKQL